MITKGKISNTKMQEFKDVIISLTNSAEQDGCNYSKDFHSDATLKATARLVELYAMALQMTNTTDTASPEVNDTKEFEEALDKVLTTNREVWSWSKAGVPKYRDAAEKDYHAARARLTALYTEARKDALTKEEAVHLLDEGEVVVRQLCTMHDAVAPSLVMQ